MAPYGKTRFASSASTKRVSTDSSSGRGRGFSHLSTNSPAARGDSHISKNSVFTAGMVGSRTSSSSASYLKGQSPAHTISLPHSTTLKTVTTNVYGEGFTTAFLEEINEEVAHDDSFPTRLRSQLAHIILNQRFEMGVGLAIMSNFVVIAVETDARARGENAANGSSERKAAEDMLSVIAVVHLLFSIGYTLECAVRMYVLRMDFFRYAWNNFDLFMVVIGILAEILEKSNFQKIDGLRTLRTIRMLRASRVLVTFDELYALVSGLTHAIKALAWAAILMLMVLTMWSIIAVEYVKPLMGELTSRNYYDGCHWCSSAFDNVFLSNLTFFQIMSGDGWSLVARPLVENHAWTALLFVAVIFSMVFGLLNLVVAVIVDSAAQAREADIHSVAARKDASRAAAWECFNDMVGELDSNGDGQISIEELRRALIHGEELGNLAAYLTTMGVELSDLDMVFELLDSDGDGHLTHEEFTHQLYQMKTQELPITMCYVRHSVAQLHNELDRVSKSIQSKLDNMLRQSTHSLASSHQAPELASKDSKESLDMIPKITEPKSPAGIEFSATRTEPEKKTGGGLLSVMPEGVESDETGGRGRKPRVSLFKGKQPPALKLPASTLRASSTTGRVSAVQVGNSNATDPSPGSRMASENGDTTTLRFSILPGAREEAENCLT